jgi:hypothetical protein
MLGAVLLLAAAVAADMSVEVDTDGSTADFHADDGHVQTKACLLGGLTPWVDGTAREKSSAEPPFEFAHAYSEDDGTIRFETKTPAIKALEDEQRPVNFVSIIGNTGTGKSWLMRKLFCIDFVTADQAEAVTQGIWGHKPRLLAGTADSASGATVVALDLEGSGDKDAAHDQVISVSALSMSKVTMFNYRLGAGVRPAKQKALDALRQIVDAAQSVTADRASAAKFGHLNILFVNTNADEKMCEDYQEILFGEEKSGGQKGRRRNEDRDEIQRAFESINCICLPSPLVDQHTALYSRRFLQLQELLLEQLASPTLRGGVPQTGPVAAKILTRIGQELDKTDHPLFNIGSAAAAAHKEIMNQIVDKVAAGWPQRPFPLVPQGKDAISRELEAEKVKTETKWQELASDLPSELHKEGLEVLLKRLDTHQITQRAHNNELLATQDMEEMKAMHAREKEEYQERERKSEMREKESQERENKREAEANEKKRQGIIASMGGVAAFLKESMKLSGLTPKEFGEKLAEITKAYGKDTADALAKASQEAAKEAAKQTAQAVSQASLKAAQELIKLQASAAASTAREAVRAAAIAAGRSPASAAQLGRCAAETAANDILGRIGMQFTKLTKDGVMQVGRKGVSAAAQSVTTEAVKEGAKTVSKEAVKAGAKEAVKAGAGEATKQAVGKVAAEAVKNVGFAIPLVGGVIEAGVEYWAQEEGKEDLGKVGAKGVAGAAGGVAGAGLGAAAGTLMCAANPACLFGAGVVASVGSTYALSSAVDWLYKK